MKKIVLFLLCTLSCWAYSQQILSLRDPYTQELVDFSEVKTFSDGKPMTDAQCDGVIYMKEKGKYYKRVFQGPVNVKWFGAKGDGNADDVGTDDTQTIKTALKVLSEIYKPYALTGGHLFGGFSLYFPKGIYLINETLKIPSCTTIVGESRYETLIHMKTPKFIFTNIMGMLNKLDVNMSNNIKIKQLTLKQGGIELQNSINSVVEDISILNVFGTNTDTAIQIRIPVNLIVRNIKIFNCSGTGIKYEDNIGTGPSTTATFENIWIAASNRAMLLDGNSGGSHQIITTRILNSIIEYNNIGIELKGNIENLVIRDIHFEQNKSGSLITNGNVSFNLEDSWTDKGDVIIKSNPAVDQSKVKIYLKNNTIPIKIDKDFKGKVIKI